MPGVEVTLREMQTGDVRTTKTTPEGAYEFLQLRPSTYEITAEEKGFQRLLQRNIVVNVGAAVRVDLTLQVGTVSQTVEVTSEIPLIEPDKTTITRPVDIKAIASLPMLGRQILNLALTAPGTIPGAPGTQVTAFSVSGMRSQSNNYTLDGISNNDPQVNGPLDAFRLTDAIQEFSVQTSIASAEVGRNSGAQVSVITKSGTNSYHGSTFYLGRNDALDANDFFLSKAGQRKNVLRRHQFGGTAGGYIVRDKTFWFFSYEGFRDKTQQPVTARVPTDAERATVTDPVSRALLQFFPAPNTTGTTNWTGTTASINNNDTYFWRIDQKLFANHRLMGRYAWFRGNTDSLQSKTAPFHGNITNAPGQHSFLVQEAWATSKIVNELRLGYSRNRTFFLPSDVILNPAKIFVDANGKPLPGFINTDTDPLDGGLPRISFASDDFASLGAGTNMPQGRATNTYEVIENISLVSPWGWTRHTLRFGGHYRHEITNRFLNGNYRGAIVFDTFNTCVDSSGKRLACFSLGRPQSGSLRTGEGGTFRTWGRGAWYLYAQDTFKLRPNLTFNYGLRWEYPGLMREKHDRGSNFVPGIGMMVLNSNLRIDVDRTATGRAALRLTPVDFHLSRSGQGTANLKNFAPFLGIAWSPKIMPRLFGEGKTVIRTGFRLGYDDVFANIPVNMGLNFPPVLTTTLPDGVYTWGSALDQNTRLFTTDKTVLPQKERGKVTFNAWDFNARSAYGMNYALEVERQLGNEFAVEVSYIGSLGRRLGVFVRQNEPFVTSVDPSKRGDQEPNVRVFPFRQYASISDGAFVSNSNYNGMVLTVRKRARHGLIFTGSYTLGKALDNNSSFFGSDRDDGSFADSRRPKLDYGRSGFDVRHRVVVSYIYELPFGPRRALLNGTHGVLGHVIGGWDISGIVNYRTGFPFTVFAGQSSDYSGFTAKADRPNWAPGVSSLPTDYSNPDNVFPCHKGAGKCPVFTQPGPGDIGNVSRNAFTGPSLVNVDFGLLKNFPVSEGSRFQFRADFFNFFNHTNFELPISNIRFVSGRSNNSKIGTVQSAQSPRLIQVGLRFEW